MDGSDRPPPSNAPELDEQDQEHAFVKALPPATDYLTYLTIIEYNLDRASLPLLEKLLRRDGRLTVNIGWDLVQLLMPLLPESEQCLNVVARLGNPREVIIKVNEMLESLGLEAAAAQAELDRSEASSDIFVSSSAEAHESKVDDTYPVADLVESGYDRSLGNVCDLHADRVPLNPTIAAKEAAESDDHKQEDVSPRATSRPTFADPSDLDQQFRQMLGMISILHPRIKTKRPSRFLLTTVEAILSSYRGLGRQILTGCATDAILDLLQGLSSIIIKPPLPPRDKDYAAATAQVANNLPADDPEAEPVELGEAVLQQGILASFATHIFETLVVHSRKCFPVDAASWTTTYLERRFPGRQPRLDGALPQSGQDLLEKMRRQELRVLHIVAGSLGIDRKKLRNLLPPQEGKHLRFKVAEELPFSQPGSLLLLAAATYEQFDKGWETVQFDLVTHKEAVEQYLGGPDSLDLGPASLAVIDAITFLGWVCVDGNTDLSLPVTEEDLDKASMGGERQDTFNRYLQRLSLVSANAPSPIVRYQTHLLVTNVIHNTRDASLRLGYISDTLEFCPFENLKVTAVGWLKDEILTSFKGIREGAESRNNAGHDDLFRKPETLACVAPALFEMPTAEDGTPISDVDNDSIDVGIHLPFWLAALNLLYLLCTNKDIRERLQLKDLVRTHRIVEVFVEPLHSLADRLSEEQGRVNFGEEALGLNAGALLADAILRVRDALSFNT